jgi:DNA modification methylase
VAGFSSYISADSVGVSFAHATRVNRGGMNNVLYYGDNLDILRRKIKDETVDLCYIDPPFNSKRNYNQIYNNLGGEDRAQAQAFVDTWIWDYLSIAGYDEIISNPDGRFRPQLIELIKGLHAVLGEGSLLAYLISIALRVMEIHRVLQPKGSFYLHCDPTASYYLKIIVDAVFCSQGGNFQNEIIWRRSGSHNSAKRYGPIHDVLFFYVKTARDFTWNKIYRPYLRGYVAGYFNKKDKNGRYRSQTLTGSGTRNGESGTPWRGYDVTAKGRHWAFPAL